MFFKILEELKIFTLLNRFKMQEKAVESFRLGWKMIFKLIFHFERHETGSLGKISFEFGTNLKIWVFSNAFDGKQSRK